MDHARAVLRRRRGITLCYETFGDPADPAALLIMGLGMQMVAWHEDFCRELAARGLHVVRFDNRDVGRSTHLHGPPPTIPQLLRSPARRALHARRHGRTTRPGCWTSSSSRRRT